MQGAIKRDWRKRALTHAQCSKFYAIIQNKLLKIVCKANKRKKSFKDS